MKGLQTAADKKVKKYKALCDALALDFSPFVTDSMGGFGPGCKHVVDVLANKLAQSEFLPMSLAVARVRRVIQCAFMRQIAENGLFVLRWARDEEEKRVLINMDPEAVSGFE